MCAPLRCENRNPRYIVLHCPSCTVPYVYTLHTGFGSSQTLQNLTKFIFKNINTYNTKYTNYETTFYNKSNNIDLALSILKLFSKFHRSRDTLTSKITYMQTQKDQRQYIYNRNAKSFPPKRIFPMRRRLLSSFDLE